jgi:DNA invertase Pin-like site-specific DNA recombinase
LSRNAHFLLGLQESGVEFVCADMPEANKLTIGLLAVVAQHEREQISVRTEAALGAAKARGVVLGGFRGVLPPSSDVATAARVARSDAFAASLQPIIREMQDRGMSLRQVAAELAAQGIETPCGG